MRQSYIAAGSTEVVVFLLIRCTIIFNFNFYKHEIYQQNEKNIIKDFNGY